MPRQLNLQEKICQLRAFYRAEGRPPSFGEMAQLFGYASKNAVYGPIRQLITRGYLRRTSQGKIVFTTKITARIPALGSVQAGFPSPAEEELLDTISLDEFLVKRPEATYILTVSGDSMQDAGIHPGDMVLVEKGGTPRQNNIVIAQVDGEWTMKYYGKDRDGVYLDPANARYSRIRPMRTLQIGGIVKAVIRKYQ
ncbi:MAG: transcriptional repressor LexA [Kiritimatiellia bacterium]